MSKQVRISGKIRNCFRSDTLSKWETKNPVLLKGEIGVVIGLNEVGDGLEDKSQKIKIGDGIHSWKELSWFSSGGTSTLDIDQTYNPESTNAQSGKALVPIFQRKLEIWQPNTEYKVGDIVVEQLVMGPQSVSNILVCIQNHTSGDDMFDTVTAVDYWQPNPIIALNSSFATCDDNGNYIIDTYATKEELNNKLSEVPTYEYIGTTYATKEELVSAIGEALEGDY